MAKSNDFFEILNSFIESENKKGKPARDLKRRFMLLREKRISEQGLNSITEILLSNYNELKDIKEVNEMLQLISRLYNFLKKENNDNAETIQKYTKIINEININVLGNEGTNAENFSYKEIEDIIKGKIENSDELLINRNDILKILKDFNNPGKTTNSTIYNNLIKNVVIPYTENDIEGINNPNAIDVLKSLALIYKEQGDYENCQKVYNKCVELYNNKEGSKDVMEKEMQDLLKDKDEVESYTKKFNQIIEPIPANITEEHTLTEKFLSLEVDNMKDLVNGLKNAMITQRVVADIPGITLPRGKKKDILPDDYEPDDEIIDDSKNPPMPVHERIEGIQRAIAELGLTIYRIVKFKEINAENDNEVLRELESQIKDYGDYILIGIEELNISILECLKDDNKSLQIIPNEFLYDILKFKKVRDQKVQGSVIKRHTKGTFANNLIYELKGIKKLREEGLPIDTNQKERKQRNRPKKQEVIIPEQQDKILKYIEPTVQEQPKEFDRYSATMDELFVEARRLSDLLSKIRQELSEVEENKEGVLDRRTELREKMKNTLNKENEILKEIKDRLGGNPRN